MYKTGNNASFPNVPNNEDNQSKLGTKTESHSHYDLTLNTKQDDLALDLLLYYLSQTYEFALEMGLFSTFSTLFRLYF